MNKVALPLMCLLAGGAVGTMAGYRWGIWRGELVPLTSGAVPTEAGSSLSPMPNRVAAPPNEGAPSSRRGGGDSLPATIDAMLGRFDPREAERWALNPALPLQEILAGLSCLSGKPQDTQNKPELKALLYRAWAAKDQNKAWEVALVDSDGPGAAFYPGAVARQVAATQPAAAVNLALTLGTGERRGAVLRDVFDEWGKADLASAVGYWNAHPELPADYEAIMAPIKSVGETNPAFAASQAAALRNVTDRGPVLAQVLIGWANRDVATALQWAQHISDPEQMRLQTMIVVDAWAVKDPAAALAFAEKIEDSGARSGAIRNAWNNWLRQNPEAAMDYLAQDPTSGLLDELSMNFSRATQSLTLDEQKALLLRVPDEEMRQRLTAKVVEGQTNKGQYLPALQLINAMPDSRNRDGAITGLGVAWGRADPQAASAWLKTQPDSSDRDLAIEGFTRSMAVTDPKAAIEWIASVPDKGIREGGLKNVAAEWFNSDPAAAGAWLSTQTWISDSEKAEMLKRAATKSPRMRYTYGVNVTNRR